VSWPVFFAALAFLCAMGALLSVHFLNLAIRSLSDRVDLFNDLLSKRTASIEAVFAHMNLPIPPDQAGRRLAEALSKLAR
jgi:hypothetical protein